MGEMTSITIDLDQKALASLERLAASCDLSREDFLVELVHRRAEQEAAVRGEMLETAGEQPRDNDRAEFLALLQTGVDDVEAGRVLTHDQFAERLRARFPKRKVA